MWTSSWGKPSATLSAIAGRISGQARRIWNWPESATERWQKLVQHNAVSKQEADTYRLQFEARQADIVAAEATIKANQENVRRLKYHASRSNKRLRPLLTASSPRAMWMWGLW